MSTVTQTRKTLQRPRAMSVEELDAEKQKLRARADELHAQIADKQSALGVASDADKARRLQLEADELARELEWAEKRIELLDAQRPAAQAEAAKPQVRELLHEGNQHARAAADVEQECARAIAVLEQRLEELYQQTRKAYGNRAAAMALIEQHNLELPDESDFARSGHVDPKWPERLRGLLLQLEKIGQRTGGADWLGRFNRLRAMRKKG